MPGEANRRHPTWVENVEGVDALGPEQFLGVEILPEETRPLGSCNQGAVSAAERQAHRASDGARLMVGHLNILEEDAKRGAGPVLSDEAEGLYQHPHLRGLLVVDPHGSTSEAGSAEADARRASGDQDVPHLREGIEDLRQTALDEEHDAAHQAVSVWPIAEEDAVVATLLCEDGPATIVALKEECQGLARELLSELEQI